MAAADDDGDGCYDDAGGRWSGWALKLRKPNSC